MGQVNLAKLNHSIVLKYSERPEFDPYAVSGRVSFALRASGQSRCAVGRGIRENYTGLSISTPTGQAFALDRVEVLERKSQSRRV